MSWFDPNRFGGNPYGSGGYGLHGNPHADKYLSPKQREAAEKFMPEKVILSDNATNLGSQAGIDREIQEKLKDQYGFTDYSKKGNEACRKNTEVIYNISNFLTTPPEKRD